VRNAFLEELVALADEDERVVLLTGDLGFMVLEPFASRFPDRFYNVGVAEQNMVGVATGLAEAGFVPFTYSIATFATLRPYEFIRNGPALHGLPVRIVGVGAGFDYGHNGISHFALEDVAIMRTQPGMCVIAPADAGQARAALRATHDLPGPLYFRIGKGDSSVPGLDARFELGSAALIGDGTDLAIVALGTMAGEAVRAAGLLGERGVRATVAVVSSLNPAPADDLAALLAEVPLVLAVEAHYVNGGLGSLVCEIAAEGELGCRVVRCGVRVMPHGVSGSPAHLHARFGLSAQALAETALASAHVGA
jgi:transketolase